MYEHFLCARPSDRCSEYKGEYYYKAPAFKMLTDQLVQGESLKKTVKCPYIGGEFSVGKGSNEKVDSTRVVIRPTS